MDVQQPLKESGGPSVTNRREKGEIAPGAPRAEVEDQIVKLSVIIIIIILNVSI
jgi:hypothetical protein